MMQTHTYSEIYFATNFAEKIVKNIDNNDFMDSRNIKRTHNKVVEDNIKGKLAELFIYNELGSHGISAQLDFDIYDKGIGDSFDVITCEDIKIDVKASTPQARCIMVELKKAQMWKRTGYPDYLCMVSVSSTMDGFTSKYKFGVDFPTFMQKAKLYRRADCIPNTNVKLKADNYIITMDQCATTISDLIAYEK